jgi:hypothetical protein
MLLWTNVSLFRFSGRFIGIRYVNFSFPWIACGLQVSAVSIWLLRTHSNLSANTADIQISTGPALAIAATVVLAFSALFFTIDYCGSEEKTVESAVELSIQTS